MNIVKNIKVKKCIIFKIMIFVYYFIKTVKIMKNRIQLITIVVKYQCLIFSHKINIVMFVD